MERACNRAKMPGRVVMLQRSSPGWVLAYTEARPVLRRSWTLCSNAVVLGHGEHCKQRSSLPSCSGRKSSLLVACPWPPQDCCCRAIEEERATSSHPSQTGRGPANSGQSPSISKSPCYLTLETPLSFLFKEERCPNSKVTI